MMEFFRYLAAGMLGLAFGLFFGRLLNAVVANWENTDRAVKSSITVIVFLLGGGGGAAIFGVFLGPHDLVFYVFGLAIGMIGAFFFANVPTAYSLETLTDIIRLSDALRDEVPDPEKRTLLVIAPFTPLKSIGSQAGIDRVELASRLEQAADTLGESGDPDGADQ